MCVRCAACGSRVRRTERAGDSGEGEHWFRGRQNQTLSKRILRPPSHDSE